MGELWPTAPRSKSCYILTLVLTFFLVLLWWLFLSRLRWRVRLEVFMGVLGLVCVATAFFRLHGVTGDLLPVFQWRWESSSWASLRQPTKEASTQLLAPANELTNDWPQFLGPHRNSVVEQPKLGRDWKSLHPRLLWRQSVGLGWSGFAVAGGRAITQEQRGEQEAVVCYDLLTGTPIWVYTYPAHYQSPLAGEGPRATPTITDGRVYALGSTGILNCLELATGKLVWSKDTMQDNGAKLSDWGASCSPLLVDGLVIVSAGGHENRSLVAYRATNGEFVWGNGSDGAGYSSPFKTTLAGIPQIVIFNSEEVSAHDPANGTNLWEYHWPTGHPHVSMPITVPGDCLLVSSGYGVGSELLRIQTNSAGRLTATRVWKSNRLKAKFTNLIYRHG